MTKKRYLKITSSIDYYFCVDTETNEELTKDDMVDRLNKQNEQIKELENELNNINMFLIKSAQRLKFESLDHLLYTLEEGEITGYTTANWHKHPKETRK